MKISSKILILCLLSTSIIAFSQSKSSSDSLIGLLPNKMPDTSRVLLFEQISRSLMYSKPFDALRYSKDGLALAEQINFLKGMARCKNRLGSILRITGNYGKALEMHLASVKISESINDQVGVARTNINMGILYGEQKESKKAIEYYYKAKNIAEKINDQNILQLAFLNLGTDYAALKQYDSAQFYTQKAYEISLKQKTDVQNVVLMNLADILHRTKNYTASLNYFRKSLLYSKQKQDSLSISQTYYAIATVFKDNNQTDSALYYAKKSLKLSKAVSNLNDIYQSSKMLSDYYEKLNKDEAYHYFKIAVAAKDSMFNQEKIKQIQNLEFKEKMLNQELAFNEKAFKSRQQIGVLASILGIVILLVINLYLLNRQKNKANIILSDQKQEIQTQKTELQASLKKLKLTQNQLIQKEKLASLGELTAGIAHEIQNPLNFVNNFSEISMELVQVLNEELFKTEIPEKDKEYIDEIMGDLAQNQQKINTHGKRASNIVTNMLEHSRGSTGEPTLTDLNQLADDYLRLSYHGMRAKDKNFNSDFELIKFKDLPKVYVTAQDIGRVILNLINNAFYAVNKRRIICMEKEITYQPKVTVKTLWDNKTAIDEENSFVEIQVQDNGIGINDNIKKKIFQPFFTTKPTGEGTGLGLSLSHDIITKGHNGTIEVESVEGIGTTFIIRIPVGSAS